MTDDNKLPPLPKPKAAGLGREYESFDKDGRSMGTAYENIDYFTADQMHAYAQAALASAAPAANQCDGCMQGAAKKLAIARVLAPALFKDGIDPHPNDGPNTRDRIAHYMRQVDAIVAALAPDAAVTINLQYDPVSGEMLDGPPSSSTPTAPAAEALTAPDEVAREIDNVLGIVELPPIRVDHGIYASLQEEAQASGLIVQAVVRKRLAATAQAALVEQRDDKGTIDSRWYIIRRAASNPAPVKAEGLTDAQRLDWIERNVCDVSMIRTDALRLRICWNNGADMVWIGKGRHQNWRQAIDAAIAATKRAEGGEG